MDPFHTLPPLPPSPPPPPIPGEQNDTPPDPNLEKVRNCRLRMFIEPPWLYCQAPSPDNPWSLTEFRFNGSQHVYRFVGCFPSENEARYAASQFLIHAESFARNYHADFIGQDEIDGLVYNCYCFDNPMDVVGFAVKVEKLS